jgi:hypothetical protein
MSPLLVEAGHLFGTRGFDSEVEINSKRAMDRIRWPTISDLDIQPWQVWNYMSDFTQIMEDYVSGAPFRNTEDVIMDQCGYVQHCLLCLPPASSLNHGDRASQSKSRFPIETVHSSDLPLHIEPSTQVYETARLACIGFSHLVTRPTSASLFPRLKLSEQLVAALQAMFHAVSAAEAQLAFWAASIGAIIAIGLSIRKTLVALTANWAQHPLVNVRDWQGAKQTLKMFLWHDRTNDVDALNLWVEVDALLRSKGTSAIRKERHGSYYGAGR